MSNDEFIVTSRRPRAEKSSRRYAFRMAEAFFRRWPLYLLPILALGGLGFLQARKTVADYRSIGVLSVVNNPLLGDLGTVQDGGISAYETPAAGTARTINELLGTDGFIETLAKGAGLESALATGAITINDIRSRVYASASGYQLLSVVATWPSAEAAQRLAQSAIDSYVADVKTSQVAKTLDASKFWQDRADAYQANVVAAQAALRQYVEDNPEPPIEPRPESQQLDIQALTDSISAAQEQVANALNQKENADLTAQELETAAGQALQVVDAPVVPSAPESALQEKVLTLAVFLVLGFIIAASLLLLSTFLDRTVRSAEDIASASGLAVIATVPTIARLRKRGKGSKRESPSKKRALSIS